MHIKKPFFFHNAFCRGKVFVGLALAICIIFCSSSFSSSAVVQFKKSRVLADNLGATDLGFQSVLSDSSYVIQNDLIDENFNYWDNAFYYINLVLSNTVQTYFSQTVSIQNSYASDLLSALKTIDDGSMLDRHYFLNAYLVVDENFSGKVYYQLNSETYAFKDCTISLGTNEVLYDNMNSFVYADYILNSDHTAVLNDYLSTNFYWDGTFHFPFTSSSQNINSRTVTNRVSLATFVQDLDAASSKNFYFYSRNSGTTSSTHSISYLQQISGKYILPLYIDTTIYTHGSFRYSSSYFSHYDSVNFSLYLPDGSNLSLDDFDKEYWRNYNGLESGILWTPQFPTPSPIPTFAPIVSPTPFPTLNISAILTPIAIPNNPIITSGLGDPVSVVYGVIGYLTQVLSLPQIKFFSTTVQYIYNSNIFFQILMFLVPGIILLTFMIGRLKRK